MSGTLVEGLLFLLSKYGSEPVLRQRESGASADVIRYSMYTQP